MSRYNVVHLKIRNKQTGKNPKLYIKSKIPNKKKTV